MARTDVYFKRDAREKVLAGAAITAEAVATTLGPRGRTVLIQPAGSGAPIATKDGHTVAQAIDLREPAQRLGSELIKEAAGRTNELAGDGTTTTAVITQCLLELGNRYLASFPAVELVEGIRLAVEQVIASLRSDALQLTNDAMLRQIATISANNDESIGAIVADAFSKVGHGGIITVEDAKGTVTSLDVIEGMRFDRGYLSPYFVNDGERMQVRYADALVLVTDRRIALAKDLVPALEAASAQGKALLIVADDVVDEALQTLVINRTKGGMRVVAVRAPGLGDAKLELLGDIAALAGARIVSPSTGAALAQVTRSDFGSVQKLIVDRAATTIVATGRTTADVLARVEQLEGQLKDITLTGEQRAALRSRIARLACGVAVVRVGGSTELEMVERKHRVEDALSATHAALDEGVLPGGGVALVRAAQKLSRSDRVSVQAGIDTVAWACQAPIRRIVANAGGSPDVVISQVERSGPRMGYDALKGQHVDMLEAGVIDPAKVTRLALEHAASVARTFLTLDAVIVRGEKGAADE